jgi:hypothetical protein
MLILQQQHDLLIRFFGGMGIVFVAILVIGRLFLR